MRIIALMNQKGGVGKTTTTVNLGAALAELGKKVCLVDLDPQAHLTINYGIDPSPEITSLYNVLIDGASFLEAVHKIDENIALVPSSIDLAAAEIELVTVLGREMLLKKRIEAAQHDFDYILLDCPPSLGLLTINALAVADEVIIPMQPHFLALQGVGKLLETVALVSKRMNPRLKVSGIVLTMFDAQTKLTTEVVNDLNGFVEAAAGKNLPWSGSRIFKSKIRRNIKLAESPSFGQHIIKYEPTSHGAADYRALAREVALMTEPAAAIVSSAVSLTPTAVAATVTEALKVTVVPVDPMKLVAARMGTANGNSPAGAVRRPGCVAVSRVSSGKPAGGFDGIQITHDWPCGCLGGMFALHVMAERAKTTTSEVGGQGISLRSILKVLNSGSQADRGCNLIELLHGGPCQVAGALLEDEIYRFQWRNRLTIAAKAMDIMEDEGIGPRPVRRGFLFLWMEGAGMADEAATQGYWARLLVSGVAYDAGQHPALIDTLRRISPQDADWLAKLAKQPDDAIHTFHAHPLSDEEDRIASRLLAMNLLTPLTRGKGSGPDAAEIKTAAISRFGWEFVGAVLFAAA